MSYPRYTVKKAHDLLAQCREERQRLRCLLEASQQALAKALRDKEDLLETAGWKDWPPDFSLEWTEEDLTKLQHALDRGPSLNKGLR